MSGKDLKMSVSGIRGKTNGSFTTEMCSRIAYIQTRKYRGGKVVVGRDTRPTGKEYAEAAFAGIASAGGKPVDIGIAPTPTTCKAVEVLNASTGIILTASHNPMPYNGYKMVHSTGRLFNDSECTEVYEGYRNGEFPEYIPPFPENPDEIEKEDGAELHISAIINEIDTELIQKAGLKIAVDAINGAASAVLPRLLKRLNVEWKGINTELSGEFTHNPEPRPEHLHEISAFLKENPGMNGGFIFDPDADRLVVMGEDGTPLSEEFTLALAINHLLKKTKSDIVVNLSTSMLMDTIADNFRVRLFRTRIGEANVVEGIKKHKASFGGEGNGGVIYPAVSSVRDGLAGTALILEYMASEKKSINQLASPLPRFAMIKDKIDLNGADAVSIIRDIESRYTNYPKNTEDGLRIVMERGWIQLRSSNTEPVMRLFVEAFSGNQAVKY
ncbi:MAG: hypothetical protein ACOCSE_04485, partial [Chitinivibrionales bacterium]